MFTTSNMAVAYRNGYLKKSLLVIFLSRIERVVGAAPLNNDETGLKELQAMAFLFTTG